MAEVKAFKSSNMVAYVVVRQRRKQDLEVCVVDMLEDQAGCFALRVPDDVKQGDNVWPHKGSTN